MACTDSGFSTVIYDQSGITATAQAVSGLSYSTTYYWQIVAKDSQGLETAGPIWQFTTALPPGSLRVYINPWEAATSGAKWQVDGGPWQDSGNTLDDLSPGSHDVDFLEIPGWVTVCWENGQKNS